MSKAERHQDKRIRKERFQVDQRVNQQIENEKRDLKRTQSKEQTGKKLNYYATLMMQID